MKKAISSEMLNSYFQEHSTEEVAALLAELNKKYEGSMTIDEFRALHPTGWRFYLRKLNWWLWATVERIKRWLLK